MDRTLRYLLDTDTCIYLLNGDQRVKARVAQVGIEAIAVAIVTKGELYFGAYNSSQIDANLERIREFFTEPGPEILSIDDQVMGCFGKTKAELRRKGQPIGDIDLLIAGVAISQGLKLVTNNTKHFKRIPGILLENWFTSISEQTSTPVTEENKEEDQTT
jgi:tRNA(fMet)-specific endonuclease VapC